MNEKVGFRFWAGFAGITLLFGIAAFVVFLIFTRAIIAWGFFGTIAVIVLVMLIFAVISDKRRQRQLEEDEKADAAAGA